MIYINFAIPIHLIIFSGFLGRIQWATLLTAIGFTVMLIVLFIFQGYHIGEQSRISEELSLIREDLDENIRQSDSIWNQTNNIFSKLLARG
jgi:hypothetical protein